MSLMGGRQRQPRHSADWTARPSPCTSAASHRSAAATTPTARAGHAARPAQASRPSCHAVGSAADRRAGCWVQGARAICDLAPAHRPAAHVARLEGQLAAHAAAVRGAHVRCVHRVGGLPLAIHKRQLHHAAGRAGGGPGGAGEVGGAVPLAQGAPLRGAHVQRRRGRRHLLPGPAPQVGGKPPAAVQGPWQVSSLDFL